MAPPPDTDTLALTEYIRRRHSQLDPSLDPSRNLFAGCMPPPHSDTSASDSRRHARTFPPRVAPPRPDSRRHSLAGRWGRSAADGSRRLLPTAHRLGRLGRAGSERRRAPRPPIMISMAAPRAWTDPACRLGLWRPPEPPDRLGSRVWARSISLAFLLLTHGSALRVALTPAGSLSGASDSDDRGQATGIYW